MDEGRVDTYQHGVLEDPMVRHTPAQGLGGDERAVRDRAAPFWLGGGEDVPRVLGTPLGPRDSRELFDEAGPDGGLDAVRADEDVAARRRAVVELEVYPWLPRPGLRVRDEAFVRVLAAGGAEVSEQGAVEIRAVKGEQASFVGMECVRKLSKCAVRRGWWGVRYLE